MDRYLGPAEVRIVLFLVLPIAMLSFKTLAGTSPFSGSPLCPTLFNDMASVPRCTLTFRCSLSTGKAAADPPTYRFRSDSLSGDGKGSPAEEGMEAKRNEDGTDFGMREERKITGIHVPRQKYISVSKTELLNAILEIFESKEDADKFLKFSSCLDSILHVEDKGILEEMRNFYSPHMGAQNQRTESITQQDEALCSRRHFGFDAESNCLSNVKDDKPLLCLDNSDLHSFSGYSFSKAYESTAIDSSRIAVPAHFQKSFMKLLRDAQFEELSVQDLQMAYALNSEYLLTLPIYVDWKRASASHSIIFRRGYATERQKGFLIPEKLDYLQSKLLQKIFFNLSRPLKESGKWLYEQALKGSGRAQTLTAWIDEVKIWLKDQYSLERTWLYGELVTRNQLESDMSADTNLPIWLAAQRAVPRYKGFLSSVGPRGRLMKKLLIWVGLIPATPEVSVDFNSDTKDTETTLRPKFLQRITLSNIWEPASSESCGNNVLKMFKAAFSILFSRSILQEPAFQELILLYTEELSERDFNVGDGLPLNLKIKIYERIPIPDLPVIFPHKKLSFRILDSVRLDVASILGLLAFFVNYKFENILSSPSAILLDVIAISALIIYVSRVVLGYKQTWDRYQNQ
ncbi:hypothetical protein AXF42_Ash013148 [Apostasia shenzhenica]|uniref:Uncharacterized protein n=1 Tax=Apostasia shenzhenica TaxID=1088818 RepID=A0A2I0BD59_9ASPA|nr:hypothetical protein AXF42_Ash013148 [Apostasia shenzhenica]